MSFRMAGIKDAKEAQIGWTHRTKDINRHYGEIKTGLFAIYLITMK